MNTYAEIKAQIAELESKAAQARAMELESAKAQIAEIMKTYGLTLADLASSKSRAAKAYRSVPPKFRNPETGETWTGRGREPRWLAGRDKVSFLIK